MLSTRDNALADFEFYRYTPSQAGAIIFIVLFFKTTLLHSYQLFRTRTWFLLPFLIGGCFEFVGYIARAASSTESPNWSLGPYIVQSTLLLVAPALFAASIYMELGRIVQLVGGDHVLFVRRTWLTKVFVGGDVLSFLMQAGGGGLMAGSDTVDVGEKLVLGGLGIQIGFFGLFVIAGVVFHVRIKKAPTEKCSEYPWQKHMWSLYIVSILIFIRSIVRMVEYAQGYSGYIISREWYLFVFDALLMLMAMVTMNVVHPSEVAALNRGHGKMMTYVVLTKEVHSPERNMELGSTQETAPTESKHY